MRVERVEALAFGPLSGVFLEFAEGITLVFGPNEAGKSSGLLDLHRRLLDRQTVE